MLKEPQFYTSASLIGSFWSDKIFFMSMVMIMGKVEFSTFNSQKEMKLPEYVLRISKVYRIIHAFSQKF